MHSIVVLHGTRLRLSVAVRVRFSEAEVFFGVRSRWGNPSAADSGLNDRSAVSGWARSRCRRPMGTVGSYSLPHRLLAVPSTSIVAPAPTFMLCLPSQRGVRPGPAVMGTGSRECPPIETMCRRAGYFRRAFERVGAHRPHDVDGFDATAIHRRRRHHLPPGRRDAGPGRKYTRS
jgi:hypothetical protein